MPKNVVRVLGFTDRLTTLKDIKVRQEQFENRLHIVVPVVMLTEGVHNGRLFTGEELQLYPESWNGRPVVVSHPKKDGEPVSVNESPETAENTRIGTIFNTTYADKKLKAELWIDVAKATKLAPDILTKINDNSNLEVSTGLWFLEELVKGVWHGEEYNSITRGFKPDHLALLPNEEGACSWKDGCGVRANSVEIADGEISLMDIVDKLYQMVNIPPEGQYETNKRLRQVYSNYYTFEDNKGNLYKQAYKVKKDGSIVNKDDAVKIKKLVSYETMNRKLSETFTKEKDVDKKEKIDMIINTKQTGFKEDHRAFLETLSEEQLEIQVNMAKKFVDCKGGCNDEENKEIAVNKEEGEKKPKTVQEYIQDAPDEIKEIITNGIKIHNERKAELIKCIVANKKNKFSKEKLSKMELDELENLAAFAEVTPDYSGQKGFASVTTEIKANERQSDGTGVPDAPEMKWEAPINNNRARGSR